MAKGFGGFPGGGNMQAMMQQAQKMQKDLEKAQGEIAVMEVEGSAGGGVVKVTLSGNHECLKVEISKEAIDPSDPELLQDAVMAAFNDAESKLKEASQTRLSKVTGGMSIPGLT